MLVPVDAAKLESPYTRVKNKLHGLAGTIDRGQARTAIN